MIATLCRWLLSLVQEPISCQNIFDYLNSKHVNIKFTCELEENNHTLFLDVLVNNLDGSFSSNLYRKPTFTGLGMKFNSAVNYKYKIKLILCLLERAYIICSSYQSLSNEINNSRRYFCQNGYPVKLVEKQISTKLEQLYSPPIKPDTVPKQEVYAKMPFMHDSANETLDSSLRNLVGKFYPQISLSIIYQDKNSVAIFFQL